jgi:hypothetical protein
LTAYRYFQDILSPGTSRREDDTPVLQSTEYRERESMRKYDGGALGGHGDGCTRKKEREE